MGVRRVRDATYWGVPVGTVIGPGMKPNAVARMARGASRPDRPAQPKRPGTAAALFAAGAGRGRIHAATGAPVVRSGPLSIDVKAAESDFAARYGRTAAAVATRKAAKPSPATASHMFAAADAAAVAAQLNSATSLDQATRALDGMTMKTLWAVAAAAGVAVRTTANKERLKSAIVEHTAGRRLDSLALSRLR